MVKVRLNRALYPYKVWEIAEVKQNVFDYWAKSGVMEEIKEVKEVKEKKNKAILTKKSTKWL